METHLSQLPASKQQLDSYRNAQQSDPTCSVLSEYCRKGWPDKHSIDPVTKPYWESRGELTFGEGLLLCGGRIVVPAGKQSETLEKLHRGHQGIQRCRLRAQMSVWWPGISSQIREFVNQCSECSKQAQQSKEPLISTQLPEYPWQKAATDLFVLGGKTYLLVVDYYSRFPEVIQLNTTTSESIIRGLKSVFARHGIPEILISDNGPQYSSSEFAQFSESYGFAHLTSSPHYPQSNGHAERAVKTVKKLLKETSDQYLALLSYRSTPLPWCGLSPAELSQGRRLRTDIPQTKQSLTPNWPHTKKLRQLDQEFKRKQKLNYDQRHRVKPLPELPDDTEVWVTTSEPPLAGRVMSQASAPRSYVVNTPNGMLR